MCATRFFRISAANIGPNRFHQNRTVSWLISIPRSARRSSTLRSDSGCFTYIITTRRTTSGELLKYRNGLLMPPSYHSRRAQEIGLTEPWSEISNTATWFIPAVRMMMKKPHDVPLSHTALAILRAQEAERGQNPFVFAGRPMRSLSGMSMAMLLKRLSANCTVHGMRSAARSWMADQGVPFELAEAALAHTVGNAVVQAYQRSSMLERRRPVLAWAAFVCGETGDNVVQLRRTGAW
jgi:hypothetical protein